MKEQLGGRMAEVVLDDTYGALLKELLFSGERSYQTFLEHWLGNVEEVSAAISAHLQKTYGDEIVLQLTRAGLAQIPVHPQYNVAFAFLSDIWSAAAKESDVKIDRDLLKKASDKMRRIENGYDQSYIAEPGTFAEPDGGAIAIPPTLHTPVADETKLEPGIYVSATGIPGLERIFTGAAKLGLRLYSNDPASVIGSQKALPTAIGNPAIRFQFARAGWGAIWTSLLCGTPLVLAPYDESDDPEIFFNTRRVEELGIGVIYKNQTIEQLLQQTAATLPRMQECRNGLQKRFGTLDGIAYAAQKIAADVLQKA